MQFSRREAGDVVDAPATMTDFGATVALEGLGEIGLTLDAPVASREPSLGENGIDLGDIDFRGSAPSPASEPRARRE